MKPPFLCPRGAPLPRAAVVAAVLLLVPWSAQAFRVTGTFEGIADAEGLPLGFEPARPVSYYDGAPLTGRFDIFVPDATPHQTSPSGWGNFLNGNGGYFSLSVAIKEARFDLYQGDVDPASGNFPSVFWLSGGTTGQSAQFMTDFQPKYSGGIVTLSGAPGSLFTGLDPSTLHLDPDRLPTLSGSFADATASIRVRFDATRVTYGVAAPVPEPSPVALLAFGVLALSFATRRATRRPTHLTETSHAIP